MTAIRLDPPAPSTVDALYAAYERRAATAEPGGEDDWRRDHLGASIIGHECDRYLWLSFRWALDPKHSGKQLRLFERGRREEAWIIDDMRAAGIVVRDRDPEGNQFRMLFGPHFGGSVDGLATNLPEAPDTEHVVEVKTHSTKSFAWLQRMGLKKGKAQHYAQVQVYMRGMKLDRAIYIAVCKETDDIYIERVHLDAKFADGMIARGKHIIGMATPPDRLDQRNPPCILTSKEGVHYPCQFYELCHGKRMPEKSCRTCIDCSIGDEVECTRFAQPCSGLDQRIGCHDQLTIPEMVNAQVAHVGERSITYQFADGETFMDGFLEDSEK